MPGKIKVRVLGARHLPVMDRASELTDAFVEIKFGNQTQKTEVIRKSLNPQWNSEWFRFEVDDEELQDEPLQIRVMDHDTYSAHDAIGKVYLDLNPLLCQREETASTNATTSGVVLSGWLPIFDTMHGIRGDINVIVKVDLFSDLNRYRHSSCGVHFFSTPAIPRGYVAESVFGFVEELVVNDDPEYKWIDKIRTPRASNEARQRLFSTMSGAVQRKIGLKVQEMGGNAAIGYQQAFDLEGESGIVVRGIATAVRISKVATLNAQPALPSPHSLSPAASPQPTEGDQNFWSPPQVGRSVSPLLPRKPGGAASGVLGGTAGRRKSSDSDTEAPPSSGRKKDRVPASAGPLLGPGMVGAAGPSGNPDHGKVYPRTAGILDREAGSATKTTKGTPFHRPVQKPIDFLDYPFFTITTFPPGYLVHIGGVVSARSVKLLDRILHPEEPETRDAWWAEIRTEIRSHCRAMGCHAVVGYSESTSISEDVCILSAIGTAARINVNALQEAPQRQTVLSAPVSGGVGSGEGTGPQEAIRTSRQTTAPIMAPNGSRKDSSGAESGSSGTSAGNERARVCKSLHVDVQLANQYSQRHSAQNVPEVPELASTVKSSPSECTLCHVPYDESGVPFPTQLSACSFCRQGKVPGVLFATIEPPDSLPLQGKGCLIQARVCRVKKEWRGELNAKDISDTLPFLEYELHHQLLNKLKLNGMNALFGLQSRVHVGYNVLVAIATATAVNVPSLPPATIPTLVCKTTSSAEEEAKLAKLQAKINDVARRNAAIHGIDFEKKKILYDEDGEEALPNEANHVSKRTELHGSHPEINPNEGGKEAYVIEVDDPEDMEAINIMLDDVMSADNVDVCNTEFLPGSSPASPPISDLLSESQITGQMFASVVRKSIGPNGLTHKQFGDIFSQLMDRLYFKLRHFRPCVFSKLVFDVSVEESELLQIALTGMCNLRAADGEAVFRDEKGKEIGVDGMQFKMDGLAIATDEKTADSTNKPDESVKEIGRSKPLQTLVEVSPMSFIPGYHVSNYLGNMNLFVIRETSSVREFGGISGFMHKFVAEVLALMRAHVAALGGNALLAFNLNQCVLLDNPNRNQAQCLINIAGDAVRVEPERNSSSESWNAMNGGSVAKHVFVSGGGGGGGGSSGKSASPQSPKMHQRSKDAPLKGATSNARKEADRSTNHVTSHQRNSSVDKGQRVSECDDVLSMGCKDIKNDLNAANDIQETRALSVLA